MKRTFQVVIVGSITLLVVMLSLIFKGSGVSESQVAVMPPPMDKPAASLEPKSKSKAQTEHPHHVRTTIVEPEKLEAPPMVEHAEIPPPPFPTSADLKPGMTKDEMIRKFGTPRLVASWAEKGSLAEKFIYMRDSQVTAVMLLDGKVARQKVEKSDLPVGPRRTGTTNKQRSGAAESADKSRTMSR